MARAIPSATSATPTKLAPPGGCANSFGSLASAKNRAVKLSSPGPKIDVGWTVTASRPRSVAASTIRSAAAFDCW